MKQLSNPSEIAREALRELATRRIPPTPEHYRALYFEIAGVAAGLEAGAEELLQLLALKLPRDTAERQRLMRQLDDAAGARQAGLARAALERYLETLKPETAQNWNELIANLLRQWEARHTGWTTARKRESLERVLASSDPGTLFSRLHGLIRGWQQSGSDPSEPAAALPESEAQASPPPASANTPGPLPVNVRVVGAGEASELLEGFRGLLVTALESVVPATLGDNRPLIDEGARLAALTRQAGDEKALKALNAHLRKYAWRLEMAAGEETEVRNGLLELLRLLLANIDQIVLDDNWLHGQVEVLRDIVDKPATLPMIDDAERRLKEVIFKQGQLKQGLSEAQRTLKALLAGFVDQLARFADSTGTYHDKIDGCAKRIAKARDITEIGSLLDEVLRETRHIQTEAEHSRDELAQARDRAREAEARIAELQNELDQTSRLMRHDQLTGAMNRRGLEETFHKESSRAQRRHSPLSLAVLDLDNFKRLNDTYGHQAGDQALVHLIRVVRENLRPSDSVARFGGEEFIILYPDTGLEDASRALIRLQRELTKTFFLANNQKLMITFSAGVSLWQPGEPMEAVFKRADAAMYQAKQTGKNKVVAHPAPAADKPPAATPT